MADKDDKLKRLIIAMADQDEISKIISDTPPTHHVLKIQLFSLFAKNSVEKYESRDFEAGGYKWKLVLHPNGNKNKNVKDHLSLYLCMAETSSLSPGWEVHALFKFLLLDQNNDNYLIIQGNEKRFHGMKMEWGFDEFISSKAFNDANNGYLVDDTCVFGVEVYVCKERICIGRGECLSFIKDPISYKKYWRVENFSKLDMDCHESDPLTFGDYKWKIQLYPKGKGNGYGTHLSLYLALADPSALPSGSKILVELNLRLLDQTTSKYYNKANYWFSKSKSSYGWSRYIPLHSFNQASSGYLTKDTCLFEAEIIVHGISTSL